MLILKYIDSVPLKDYLKRLCPLGSSLLYEVLNLLDLPYTTNNKNTIFSISKESLEQRFGDKVVDDTLLDAINNFLVPGVPLYNINDENIHGLYDGWSLMALFSSVEYNSRSSSIFVTIDNRILGYFQYLKHLSEKYNLI